jgi:hypothetical protein
MKTKMIFALLMVILLSSLLVVLPFLFDEHRIHNQGTIKSVNVDIFSDPDCTIPCDTLNWGNFSLGETKVHLLYIKNTGNTPMNLSFVTHDWLPIGFDANMTLSWNYDNHIMIAGEILPMQIFLYHHTYSPEVTDFSFTIVITGEEVV